MARMQYNLLLDRNFCDHKLLVPGMWTQMELLVIVSTFVWIGPIGSLCPQKILSPQFLVQKLWTQKIQDIFTQGDPEYFTYHPNPPHRNRNHPLFSLLSKLYLERTELTLFLRFQSFYSSSPLLRFLQRCKA